MDDQIQNAPGTTFLIDTGEQDEKGDMHLHALQHAQTGDGRILLVPQPSLTNPNDPLKWSLSKKWTVLLIACCYSFLGAVTGPIMAAGKNASRLETQADLSKEWCR
jgi:hypothetical protein